MAAETWFEADRAAELGFVDRVAETTKAKAQGSSIAWDLSAYANAPTMPAPPGWPIATIRCW